MTITKDLIEHLANLARLELTAEEKKRYLKDLSSILDYVEKIQKSGVKDGSVLIDERVANVWRQDEVEQSSVQERRAILEAFPEKDGDLLKVKGVFE